MCVGGKSSQPSAPVNPAPYPLQDSHKGVTQTTMAAPPKPAPEENEGGDGNKNYRRQGDTGLNTPQM